MCFQSFSISFTWVFWGTSRFCRLLWICSRCWLCLFVLFWLLRFLLLKLVASYGQSIPVAFLVTFGFYINRILQKGWMCTGLTLFRGRLRGCGNHHWLQVLHGLQEMCWSLRFRCLRVFWGTTYCSQFQPMFRVPWMFLKLPCWCYTCETKIVHTWRDR